MRRITATLGMAIGLLALPGLAGAHCCQTMGRIRLTAVDPTATPHLTGTATVLDCFGVISLLGVSVSGIVPDGTSYAIAIPAAEPILGDFFTMSRRHGEGWIRDLTIDQVRGREIDVVDDAFTPVLSGKF